MLIALLLARLAVHVLFDPSKPFKAGLYQCLLSIHRASFYSDCLQLCSLLVTSLVSHILRTAQELFRILCDLFLGVCGERGRTSPVEATRRGASLVWL